MCEAIKNNDLGNLAERLGMKKGEAARRRRMLPGASTSLVGATMGRDTLTDWLDTPLDGASSTSRTRPGTGARPGRRSSASPTSSGCRCLGQRLARQALEHRGIYLQWPGERHHIDFINLAGRPVWVYGQTDLTTDLMDARAACGQQAFYQASQVTAHDVGTGRPHVTFIDDAGAAHRVDADIIAGCDGFHGPSRRAIPGQALRTRGRDYPFT
jgi:hypothetical protein